MFATANIQFAEKSFCMQRQFYFCNCKCSICRDNLIFAVAKLGDSFKKISSFFLTKKISQRDPNISNNMNSLIDKAVQDFNSQSGRFAME